MRTRAQGEGGIHFSSSTPRGEAINTDLTPNTEGAAAPLQLQAGGEGWGTDLRPQAEPTSPRPSLRQPQPRGSAGRSLWLPVAGLDGGPPKLLSRTMEYVNTGEGGTERAREREGAETNTPPQISTKTINQSKKTTGQYH